MIIHFLLSIINTVGSVLTFWLPDGSVLPWGIDSVFVNFFGMINSLKVVMWPIVYPLKMFSYYVLFLLGMMLLKAIIGHRAPSHN